MKVERGWGSLLAPVLTVKDCMQGCSHGESVCTARCTDILVLYLLCGGRTRHILGHSEFFELMHMFWRAYGRVVDAVLSPRGMTQQPLSSVPCPSRYS